MEDTVRRVLEQEKAKGRSSAEAAGIVFWDLSEQQRQGIIANRQEAEATVFDWLRADVGERAPAHELLARDLAAYLSANVDVRAPELPEVKIESGLRAWRHERGLSGEDEGTERKRP